MGVQEIIRRPAVIRRILIIIVFMIPLLLFGWKEKREAYRIIRYRVSPSTLCSLPTKMLYYLV